MGHLFFSTGPTFCNIKKKKIREVRNVLDGHGSISVPTVKITPWL
jgi:hypothetical protein